MSKKLLDTGHSLVVARNEQLPLPLVILLWIKAPTTACDMKRHQLVVELHAVEVLNVHEVEGDEVPSVVGTGVKGNVTRISGSHCGG